MPKVKQTYYFEIKPQQYLDACSDEELYQIYLMIGAPRFYQRLKKFVTKKNNGHPINPNNNVN